MKNLIPIFIIVVSSLITGIGGDLFNQVVFDRSDILEGEVWRLFTGHMTHTEPAHLLLNMAGLIVVWILFHPLMTLRQWIFALIAAPLLISAGFLLFAPHITHYVGLSGVLRSLFIVGALLELHRRKGFGTALLAFYVVLLVWEQIQGGLPWAAQMAGGPVATEAHLFGFISGVLIYGVVRLISSLAP